MGKAPQGDRRLRTRSGTVFQRHKEEAADYRYFPEPDLVPVVVDEAWLARVRAEIGESPAATRERLPRQYGLSEYDVGVLTGAGAGDGRATSRRRRRRAATPRRRATG